MRYGYLFQTGNCEQTIPIFSPFSYLKEILVYLCVLRIRILLIYLSEGLKYHLTGVSLCMFWWLYVTYMVFTGFRRTHV